MAQRKKGRPAPLDHLRNAPDQEPVATAAARAAGEKHITRECRRRGQTVFVLEGRGYYRCTDCRKDAVSRWRRRAKQRLIEAAGGECAICGYHRYQGALHFHHVDPDEKDFGLAMRGLTRPFDALMREAEKCVLLCGNCHAEVEAGLAALPARGGTTARSSVS